VRVEQQKASRGRSERTVSSPRGTDPALSRQQANTQKFHTFEPIHQSRLALRTSLATTTRMRLSRCSYDRASAPSPEFEDGVRKSTHTKRHRPVVVEDSDSSGSGDGESERDNIASSSSGMLVVLKYRQREPKSPPFLKPAASRSPTGSWFACSMSVVVIKVPQI
jgi:hypothetical protein